MLALTPTPPRWIAASNAMRCIGSTLAPASAPNSTAEITLPVASASCAMSPWMMRLAAALQPSSSARGIDAAVGHRDPLGHRIDAVGRDDEGGAVRRDQAALHRAAGLHQLRGDDDVDVARHRRQAQHRRRRVRLGAVLRKQLDVIVGRAGALRDARHRGHLRDVAGVLGDIDDPFRQHAAAFAAHGEDGDGDRALGGRVHGQAAASRRSMRRWKKPITAPRTRAMKRSQPVGLVISEAR